MSHTVKRSLPEIGFVIMFVLYCILAVAATGFGVACLRVGRLVESIVIFGCTLTTMVVMVYTCLVTRSRSASDRVDIEVDAIGVLNGHSVGDVSVLGLQDGLVLVVDGEDADVVPYGRVCVGDVDGEGRVSVTMHGVGSVTLACEDKLRALALRDLVLRRGGQSLGLGGGVTSGT